MSIEHLRTGYLVQIATSVLDLDGGIGEVVRVGAPASLAAGEIVGTAKHSEAVLVEMHEPTEGSVWIAAELLTVIGVSDWQVPDSQGPVARSSLVRVRATPETEQLGLAGLVGELMGDTKPSSSGVMDIIGEAKDDYAVSAWFEERDEQYWFAPALLVFLNPISGN